MNQINPHISIRIVVHWDTESRKYFLTKYLEELGYSVNQYSIPNFDALNYKSRIGKAFIYYQFFKVALTTILSANDNDIIVATNFHVGAIASILAPITKKSCKILGINLILGEKPVLINFLRKVMFGFAFKNKNFFFTVNNYELLNEYQKYISMSFPHNKIFELKDHYVNPIIAEGEVSEQNYIFTGGENSRDWSTLFRAAELIPEVKFLCVARKRLFSKIKPPPNVVMYFDIDYTQFINLMKNCCLVALPLNKDIPAGLLVMFDAVALGKPVIITRTSITQNYIVDAETGILIDKNDYNALANNILELMHNKKRRDLIANKMRDKLFTEYSASNYSQKIEDILQKLSASSS